MKKGDLVKRKPEWGPWVEYNPWMCEAKDFQIGIVVAYEAKKANLQILWSDQSLNWENMSNLEAVNEIST